MGARSLGALLFASALALGACGVDVEHALDERQANQIVALLDEHGIAADKARDEAGEGYKVAVARADLARSFQILDAFDLPRRGRRGMSETLAERSLVPSTAEERARLSAAGAAELERTLERVPGVVSARVHLAQADGVRFDSPAPPARAAVLLRTDGAPGISAADVQALVAGATSGLDPASVAVVVAAGRPPASGGGLETVGPLRVARGERGRVVAIAASALALLVALGAALLFTVTRLQAQRVRGDQSPSNRSG